MPARQAALRLLAAYRRQTGDGPRSGPRMAAERPAVNTSAASQTMADSGLGSLGLGGSFLDQGLQLTLLEHLEHDVAAADQLTADPQLREGRPVGVLGQVGADFRVLQDVDVGELLATTHHGLRGTRREATLWGI